MIKLNYKNTDAMVIGQENGLDIEQEFNNYQDTISTIITDLNKRKDKPGQWLQWMNLGYNEETVWYVKEFASMVEGRFDNVLVLGIGGSALGGIAVTEALLKPYWNLLTPEQRNGAPRIFFLDNIDPDSINGLLSILDLKKTLVNVITKSGSTAETMSQFMIVKNKLEEELGDDYRKNIVATTDKKTGILRQLADQEGYKTFVVPDDVGGRFSVFSAVGLLPFALVGIDIDEITSGIKDMDLALIDGGLSDEIPLRFFESRGFTRNVVVTTRPHGYRKFPSWKTALSKPFLLRYPAVYRALRTRHVWYNAELEHVDARVAAGAALLIAPDEPLEISRLCHDPDVMQRVYDIGRSVAERRLDEVLDFIGRKR